MKEVGGQHPQMERDEPGKIHERGRGQRQMEESGGHVFTGAPMTLDVMGQGGSKDLYLSVTARSAPDGA